MIEWTDETDREAAEYCPTLSEREIRRRQDITAQQIVMAHRQGNEDALADLRRQEGALAREMIRRLRLGTS